MRATNIQEGQTLLDVAMQECGDQSAVTAIALLNGLDVTATPPAGTTLLLPDVVNKRIRKYYTDNNIQPATKLPE